MKNNRRILVLFILVFVILLSACGNDSNESSAKLDNQSQNSNTSEDTNDDPDSIEMDSNIDDTNNSSIEKEGTSNNVDEEDNNTSGLKEEYLKKLKNAKKETNEIKTEHN